MPDDLTPDDRDAQYDDVRAALGELTFLAPAHDRSGDRMPDDVWSRLQGALDAEAARRAVADHDNVLALPAAPDRASAPRNRRWAGGLVAASVAIVAVGLAVGTVRGGGQDAVVAGGAPALSSAPSAAARPKAGPTPASAEAFAAEAAAPQDATESTPAPPAAGGQSATVVPASRMVMASKTNYLPGQFPGQVVSLVKDAGFQSPQEAREKVMPTAQLPVEDGFTSSWEALRACITWLTRSPDSQALIVDRGTYAGTEAGVIVAPATTPDADPATPSPSITVTTGNGVFDVWVVNPECQKIQTSLDDFALYAWQP